MGVNVIVIVRRSPGAIVEGTGPTTKAGASETDLQAAATFHKKAQWRLDFVAAENSMGFHAPQEMARILGEVIDHARQGQLEAERAMRKR